MASIEVERVVGQLVLLVRRDDALASKSEEASREYLHSGLGMIKKM